MIDIAELERRVVADPDNADLRHLLGAHYAQHGDFERATRELYRAITLKPDADVARFQLALLYLTLGDTHRAATTLGPLEDLPDEAAIKSFKRGLEALMRNEFDGCRRLLTDGIARNSRIPALNEDMRLILARLPKPPPDVLDPPEQEGTDVRTDFSLYSTRH
jgi:tetratricopeptide (TPR) repeat protein